MDSALADGVADSNASSLLGRLNQSCNNNSQEPFPAVAKVAAAITFPLIFVLGFFGNLLVIIVVFRNQKMQSTTHVLMVSLAFADLLFIAFCVPTTLANYIAVDPFDELIMILADYVNYSTCYLSIYTLVLIVYATESRPYRTVRNTVLSIVALWPIIWFSQTFMFVTESAAESDSCVAGETSASTTKTLVFFLSGYLIPLCLIIVLYGAVIRRLFLTTNVGQSKRNLRSKRRAANLVVIVIACFAGSYLPVHILFLYQQYWMKSSEVPTILVLQVCANVATYMNSCINPILYAFLSRHFRDAFLQLFKDVSQFICACEPHNTTRSHSHSRTHNRVNDTTKVTRLTTTTRGAELSDSSADSSANDGADCAKKHAKANSAKMDADGCQNRTVIKVELEALMSR